MNLASIKRPCLLIDRQKVKRNIEVFRHKTQNNNIILRPHFKTHQSIVVGDLFKQAGIQAITVSSMSMAKFFAGHGWKDICIAFPFNIREIDDLQDLASYTGIIILISSREQFQFLAAKISSELRFYLKIDTGSHRAGIPASQTNQVSELLKISKTNPHLKFIGFLSHFGNTYSANSKNDIVKIYKESIKQLEGLKSHFIQHYPELIISVGDTPSCSLIEDFTGVDEIRPGNFVYYDLMQKHLGTCTYDQIAVAVACPVIDLYPERNEILIYGGAVHFSKEYLCDRKGNKTFGSVVELNEKGWGPVIKGALLKSISQEHGIIKANKSFLSKIRIGDLIGILPVHSCLTADLLKDQLFLIN